MVGAANYGNISITIAEGHALRDGMQAMVAAGYRNLDIEGDNLIVIGALKGETEIPCQIQNVIKDIRVMISKAGQVKIRHIYWEANMAVDWLSKYGHLITGKLETKECFNIDLQNIIRDDMIGRTLTRRGA